MDTVVLVLMLLTAFNFLLKQTFWKLIAVGIITCLLYTSDAADEL